MRQLATRGQPTHSSCALLSSLSLRPTDMESENRKMLSYYSSVEG